MSDRPRRKPKRIEAVKDAKRKPRETKQQRIDREFREAMRRLLLQLGRKLRKVKAKGGGR